MLKVKRLATVFLVATVVYLIGAASLAHAAWQEASTACWSRFLNQEVPAQSAYRSNPPDKLLNTVLAQFPPSQVVVYTCTPYEGHASFMAFVRWAHASGGNDYAFLHYVDQGDGYYACNGGMFSLLNRSTSEMQAAINENHRVTFRKSDTKVLEKGFAGGMVLIEHKNSAAPLVTGFGVFGEDSRAIFGVARDASGMATVMRLAWSTQAEQNVQALPRSKTDWWTGWY